MAERMIRHDRKGYYVLANKRKFYANEQTGWITGAKVDVYSAYQSDAVRTYNRSQCKWTYWATTDAPIPQKAKAKTGYKDLRFAGNALRIQINATRAKPLMVTCQWRAEITFDDWDQIVREVAEAIQEAQVDPIRAKLEAELALEEQIDEIRQRYSGDLA